MVSSKWTIYIVNLDQCPFRQSKITLVGSNFGPSKTMDVEHNFGLSKITVVDRNFGPSKSTIVDHYFGHPKLRLWTAILDRSFFWQKSSCRKTRRCIIGPYHQRCGPDSIEKDSWSARRANCSRQRRARLHTVGFGLAERQPICWVCRRLSLHALYPSHKS